MILTTRCYLLAMRTYNQTPVEIEHNILNAYVSGSSSVIISKQFNIDPTTILKIVRRYGVIPRTTRETSKRYTFNENFFEHINTEEKAYWLGFILADGCVSRGKDIIISIKDSDKHHLDKFIKSIEGNNKYQVRQNNRFGGIYKLANISIRSKKMYLDLNKLNITERKSLIVIPPIIMEPFKRHFWRGVIDGDGHICINNQPPYKSIEIGLCGNKPVIEEFIKYIKEALSFEMKLSKDHNIWRTRTSGKKSLRLCALLYDGSTVYLDRKLRIYEQYKQNHANHSRSPS